MPGSTSVPEDKGQHPATADADAVPRPTPAHGLPCRGHGIRAQQYIAKGAFVVEYSGEVVDAKELELRMQEARRDGEQHFYIMELAPGEPGGRRGTGGQGGAGQAVARGLEAGAGGKGCGQGNDWQRAVLLQSNTVA